MGACPEKQKPSTKTTSIFPWKKEIHVKKQQLWFLEKLISASAIRERRGERKNKDGIPLSRSMGEHLGLGLVCLSCVHTFWLWTLCISPKELEGMPLNYQQRIPDCSLNRKSLGFLSPQGLLKVPQFSPQLTCTGKQPLNLYWGDIGTDFSMNVSEGDRPSIVLCQLSVESCIWYSFQTTLNCGCLSMLYFSHWVLGIHRAETIYYGWAFASLPALLHFSFTTCQVEIRELTLWACCKNQIHKYT